MENELFFEDYKLFHRDGLCQWALTWKPLVRVCLIQRYAICHFRVFEPLSVLRVGV